MKINTNALMITGGLAGAAALAWYLVSRTHDRGRASDYDSRELADIWIDDMGSDPESFDLADHVGLYQLAFRVGSPRANEVLHMITERFGVIDAATLLSDPNRGVFQTLLQHSESAYPSCFGRPDCVEHGLFVTTAPPPSFGAPVPMA